ncbi:hypothetical protein ACFQ49_09660 [Kroppenstedtia eburnea]|uniref:Protein kinase domain-containing protein n=1 Tax=Kroppenstedtia eburnea TaxID=714067 RepID=A0A1N7MXM3_9BACL|nr:hypothetical protein [Kroppenstedtia eburnea]QKI80717.1 hypothetical protein GXN75_01060 [Kroppenstedtia eburnea]SIS90845.1 hypothetical protein SAMN05421790_107116 [Kroppenstedtia eburnea]
MKIKQKGERIRGTFRVFQSFPFIQGVLYYTEVTPRQGESSESSPTRFLHGLDIRLLRKGTELRRLLKRDRNAFFPVHGLFVEEGTLYQVFGKLEGNLMAHHLYRSVPLPLNQAIHFLRSITGHLVRIHKQGLFTVVHPQNMLITPDSIRFLYGGPLGLLPKTRGSRPGTMDPVAVRQQDQAMDAYSLGALAYIMFTGTSPAPGGKLLPVRSYRGDVPQALEHLIMQSLLAAPQSRPRVEEFWNLVKEGGSQGISRTGTAHSP